MHSASKQGKPTPQTKTLSYAGDRTMRLPSSPDAVHLREFVLEPGNRVTEAQAAAVLLVEEPLGAAA